MSLEKEFAKKQRAPLSQQVTHSVTPAELAIITSAAQKYRLSRSAAMRVAIACLDQRMRDEEKSVA